MKTLSKLIKEVAYAKALNLKKIQQDVETVLIHDQVSPGDAADLSQALIDHFRNLEENK